MEGERYLRSGEVARLFGVDVRTVNMWVRAGRLVPAFATPGGHYRFARSAIMEALVRAMATGEPLGDIPETPA